MKLQIVLDPAFIVDMFVPATDPQRVQRITRMQRHILVGSRELCKVWDRLLEQPPFRENAFLQEALGDWFTDILTSASKYLSVTIAEPSQVQGEVPALEKILLDTAYASPTKIVVADVDDAVREANPDLTFVSKDAFSKPSPNTISTEQIESVVRGESNLKNELFSVFETPISFFTFHDDAELLAQYFACFYDEGIVIQDNFFVSNAENEANFHRYILPHLRRECEITIRVRINRSDPAQVEKLSTMQQTYANHNDFKIRIEEKREKIHDGLIESNAYQIQIPYRMFVFGRGGKTTDNIINIRRR